jgi:hypothetical protein
MVSVLSILSSSKQTLILISIIAALAIVDSEFINIFYGTGLGTPSNLHMLLFVSLVIVAFTINTLLLLFVKRNNTQAPTGGLLLFRAAYIGTSAVQYGILFILFTIIIEMLIFHEYNKIFTILVVYLSHFAAAALLALLSFKFIQWFQFTKTISFLVYAVIFIVIIFLILITIPLLTEQFKNQPQLIYPRNYSIIILNILVPSSDIAFIFGLGNYVLPLMIVASWILTVSLFRSYINILGKKTFWLIVTIPLLYQIFSFIVRDANLVTDPVLIQIIYSQQFQFLLGISFQVSGFFFAIAFLAIGRNIKRKSMKNYLMISSIGIISLFSSVQPGLPFYAAYPPFGLVTLVLLGLSSYLLLVGMLGSAAYVSRDSDLRREIYKSLAGHSDIFSKMGLAEMERELQKKVLSITEKTKSWDEMRVSTEPDEENVKMMIDEVLREIHSKRSDLKSGER